MGITWGNNAAIHGERQRTYGIRQHQWSSVAAWASRQREELLRNGCVKREMLQGGRDWLGNGRDFRLRLRVPSEFMLAEGRHPAFAALLGLCHIALMSLFIVTGLLWAKHLSLMWKCTVRKFNGNFRCHFSGHANTNAEIKNVRGIVLQNLQKTAAASI